MTERVVDGGSPTPRINPLGDFRVTCKAGEAVTLNVVVDTVSFVLAQRIRLENNEQLWESLQVSCYKEEDGSLAVEVLLWDPKSEEALQIAHLRSRPDGAPELREGLECGLERKILK
jgi:hypothetical protein